MKYYREIVNEPLRFDKRHLSSRVIEVKPFGNAKLKQGGYGVLDSSFWLQRISNRGFHVVIITLSGIGRIIMEDETELILKEGDTFLSNSKGQGHHEETYGDKPWEMIWFTVYDSTPRFIFEINDYSVVKINHLQNLKEYFLNIFKEETYFDYKSLNAIELYEELFFITLERALGWTESNENKRNRQKLAALWETVSKTISEPWHSDALCKEVGLSRAHLSRLCKELYSLAPGEKVREIKMGQAKVLLNNSTLSITQIAEYIGYENISTFSTAFSSYFKASPREYKKRQF